ncbi:MAG: hypothetical protein A2149_05880 [Candidatus Schekmanbacteria bacterium RBG_16_38_11]|uniref:Uncharacterized protein n=1 Tax=Candidatus Schekmanbacteria bacterium RBG_16_38_11 TaxID=1817880 RepID=A0A1F7RTF5_9BACT|nr:MAG: hypothetical protein A2149_05880 [Candidatus Schekmanbacteria bacterium RBG_16_38_11]
MGFSHFTELYSHIMRVINNSTYLYPDRRGFLTRSFHKAGQPACRQAGNVPPIGCDGIYGFHYRIIILLCLLIFSVASFSFADERVLDLSPLYYRKTDEAKQLKEVEILGSVFELKYSPEARKYSLKPFFNLEEDTVKKEKLTEILWPIGKFKRTEKGKLDWILPLYYSKYDTWDDGKETGTTMLLPFYIGGEAENGNYHLFFPLYGNLKGWFNKDEIKIALFPLYSSTVKGNDSSTEVMWPIFHYAKGEGHEGYRLWPFYGYDKKEGKHLKRFYLWPFVNYQKFYEGDKLVKTSFLSLPFYGFTESEKRSVETIMFPLYVHDKSSTRKYNRYDIIWPIFSFSRGEGRHITQFFPLFRFDRKGDTVHDVILWPFYWFDKVSSDGYERKESRLVPFFEDRRESWEKDKTDGRLVSLWPFYSYKRDRKDNVKISSPSLLAFLGYGKFREKMEENYSFLWAFYKYEGDKEGNSKSAYLWSLYKDQKSKTGRSINIPLFFSYNRDEKGEKTSFLKGLFETKKEGDKTKLKLFYIPLF